MSDGEVREGFPSSFYYIPFLNSSKSYLFPTQKLSSSCPLTKALFLKYFHGSRYGGLL